MKHSGINKVNIVSRTLLYIILLFFGFFMILPFYWSLISSMRPDNESIKGVSFIIREFTFEHYTNLFKDMPMFTYLINTIIVTGVGIFSNLFFCSLAAFALSKYRFKGRNLIHSIFLFSMMVPGIILLVPQYIITYQLGLINTFAGVILPGAIGVYGIMFMRQFFMSSPSEIAEAARIDGAGELRIFTQLYLPLVGPGLVTFGIISFNSYWNSFLWPYVVLQDEELYLLTVGLKNYTIYYSENMGPLMAGSIVVMIPVLVVYILGQKHFVNTAAFEGVKG